MIKYLTIALIMALHCAQTASAYDNTTLNQGSSEKERASEERKPIWNRANKERSTAETKLASEETSSENSAQAQIKPYVLRYVRDVYHTCAGNWKSAQCITSLASLSKDIVVDYAVKLETAGQKAFHEPLKQKCAASTAALQTAVPAYAQKSAMTECLNAIADMSQASDVKPDLELYQLAIGALQCVDKEGSCEAFENQISSHVQEKSNTENP